MLGEMFVPDQNIFDAIPVTRHASEEDAAAGLQKLGQVGTAPNPQWLFRGQVSRQPKRKWPPVDEPQVKMHALEMEQLQPSDYRELEARLEKGESKAGLDPIYGDRVVGIRSTLTTYLMQCHSCWGDTAIQAWFVGLAGSSKADKLLSIGQHYGLRTHLMDWSADWEAAMWFASHQWTTGDYVKGGDGVIYQLKVRDLVQAEHDANAALGLVIPNAMRRHVDIRDTPALLAPRASAQRGASIANVESPCFLQELIRQNALSVHVFPRGTTPSSLNSITKEQLVPPADQMAALFDEAGQGGALFQHAIGWIHANFPTLTPTVHDRGLIFA